MSLKEAALHSAVGLAAVGVGGLAYASLIERNAFTLRRASIPVLPHGAASLRVLHVSDIHLVPRQARKTEWIRSLGRLEPDLVINTGDNLGDLRAVPAVLRALEPLLAVPGVFVLGSNDYFAPSLKNPGAVPDEGTRSPERERSAADRRSCGRLHPRRLGGPLQRSRGAVGRRAGA